MKPSPYQARILRLMRDYALEIQKSEFKRFPGMLVPSEKIEWPVRREIDKVIRDELKRNKILTTTVNALEKKGWIILHKKTEWGLRVYYLTSEGAESIKNLSVQEFISKSGINSAISAKFMVEALRVRHPRDRGWLGFEELVFTKGWNARRIDLFFFNFFRSKNFQRIAYEIKRSRGNLLSELKTPEKHEPVMVYANYFFFATPKGIVKPSELPEKIGLVEIDENGVCRMKKKALHLGDIQPSWYLVGNILRRSHDEEEAQERMDGR